MEEIVTYLNETKQLFNLLTDSDSGLNPDRKTYVLLLNACNHSGDLDGVNDIFYNKINNNINIQYDIRVCSAFIDCLTRKGYLNNAFKIINKYEEISQNNHSNYVMCMSLLNGHNNYKDNELNELDI